MEAKVEWSLLDSDSEDSCREALNNEGAGVNTRDQHGRTPLISAVSKGHAQCVNPLIKAGADVNVSDRYGLTPLIFAVQQNRHQCVISHVEDYIKDT